jgi:ferric-dicitrate binding protein FerR (iron transport regulator)
MSAMPAGWTELSQTPHMGAPPEPAQRRADRRAEQKLARRARQRWAIAGCAILAAVFGLTVGILDVLH